MAIVTPGNDAFRQILKKIAGPLGRSNPIVKAVAVVPNRKEGKTIVRLVLFDQKRDYYDQLKVGDEVTVTDGNVAEAIASVLGENNGDEVVIAYEHIKGNTGRWVLWNPTTEEPELVNGELVTTAHFRDVV